MVQGGVLGFFQGKNFRRCIMVLGRNKTGNYQSRRNRGIQMNLFGKKD